MHKLWRAKRDKKYFCGNIYFDIITISSLYFIKPCLGFYLVCFAWEIEGFFRFHEEMMLISSTWCAFPPKSWLKIKISKIWDMVSRFSRTENLKKCTIFQEQKGTKAYSWKYIFWHYHLQQSFFYKTVSGILYLICFAWEIKAFIRFHEEMRLIPRTWCNIS